MDYLCAKFGDFIFSRFAFIVRTDTQTDRERRIIAILKPHLHQATCCLQHVACCRQHVA